MSLPSWRSPWPLRLVWLVLPLVLGPALSDALGTHSRPVQLVGSALAWGCWVVALGAMAVPRSSTLTVVRLLVPGALPLAVWSAGGSDTAWSSVAGVAAAATVLVLLGAPGCSDAFVDGSSYGTERRVALKVPPGLLLVVVPLAWAVAAAGLVTGPLLLAAEQWLAGAVASVVGIGAVSVVGRQLHLLSRRWLVFVPAGLVVHDPLTLTDAVLFPRAQMERVGPAEADRGGDDVLDATGSALGLALEVRSQEPVRVGVRRGRDADEREGVRSILVTPTQPAVTLDLAAQTRLPVG